MKMQSWVEDAADTGLPSAKAIASNAVTQQGETLRLPGILAMRHNAGDGSCFDVPYYMVHNKVGSSVCFQRKIS